MMIGIDGRFINDQYHGIGRYTFELAKNLVRNYSEDRFVIFTNRKLPNHRFDLSHLSRFSNVKMVDTGLSLFRPLQHLIWPALLRKHRIDLFHTPYIDAPQFSPCPVVVTIHDTIFERYPAFMPNQVLAPVYRQLTKRAIGHAKKVLTVSHAAADDIVHYYPAARHKIAVTPLATGTNFRPSSAERLEQVKRKYNLPSKFVLTVGTYRPQKNVAQLIRAFNLIQTETNATLVLAGGKDERWDNEVDPLIDEFQLRARVIQLGKVAEADLPALYQLADLFVFPSLIEGFGLPVLEAMACGTAVAVSNRASLPEVVGRSAPLFDPTSARDIANAMIRILSDEGLRQRYEEMALRRAAQFDWQCTAFKTMDAYCDAIDRYFGMSVPDLCVSSRFDLEVG